MKARNKKKVGWNKEKKNKWTWWRMNEIKNRREKQRINKIEAERRGDKEKVKLEVEETEWDWKQGEK